MTNTIANLWNGNLEPIRYLGQNSKEIKQLENLLERNQEKLEETLTEISKKLFEKYNDCMNEYILLTTEQAFCDGFCLGVKIISEALNGAEEII